MNRKPNNLIQRALIILFLHIIFANTMLAQINTNLPVGAIPGAIDVSPMGAATYTIPIEVVPGTQGMQPNLSIVYNSSGGMGLLGMKWDLVGLSAITRSGQLPYFNGNLTAIQFNSSDRFNLDGNRLCNIEGGTYGAVGTKYAMEMEDFTYFVSNEGSPGHPKYFTAYTDDGSIVEYGYTSDSRQTLGIYNVLSWFINKITDVNGNYMTYHYEGTKSGEIWINEIQYTGNTGMVPYAKVKFSYDTIPSILGKNTYFVGGYGVPKTRYITSITVSYNNSNVSKYQFIYNLNGYKEKTLHLMEIVLHNSDETQQLNSTKVIWNQQNNIIDDTYPSGVLAGNIVTGDFNGDGYTDYVVYNKSLGNSRYWQLYINDGNNGFYPHSSTNTIYQCNAYSCDYDGDGRDELVLAETNGLDGSFKITLWHFDNYNWTPDGALSNHKVDNFVKAHFADFKGDGKVSIMYQSSYKVKNDLHTTLTFSNFEQISIPPINYVNIDNVSIIDCNGNGKANIQVIKGNDVDIWEYSSLSKKFEIIFTKNYPTKDKTVYYGDFNGDGITDILQLDFPIVYKYYDTFNEKWRIEYGVNGTVKFGLANGTYLTSENEITIYYHERIQILDQYFNYHFYPKYSIFIADINGDGKDDIIQPEFFSKTNKTKFHTFFSKGYTNQKYQFSSIEKDITGDYSIYGSNVLKLLWFLGDFNGDGKNDLLIRTSITDANPKIISFNKNELYEFVKEITDGLGKKVTISYTPKYLNFIATSLSKENKSFMHLTSEIQISNGIGGMNKLQFSYVGPTYSAKRRTFLGFWRFTTTNIDGNIVTTDTIHFRPENYPSNDSREMLLPVSKIHAINDYPYTINRTGYSYQRIPLPYNRVIIHNHFTRNQDFLSDTKTENTSTLENGRIKTSVTNTYNSSDLFSNTWLHSETQTYSYQTITLNGNQKKTVPTQVLTTQQYGSTGIIIADTVTYGYYPASEKGRMKWQRQGNIDGCITTNYEYLNPAGVCTLMTVSAAGCDPRTEKYEYDATRRFVTKITNPLNHVANFTYDAKTGNKLTETDANVLTTTYIYDNFGKLKQINHPEGTITKDTIYWYSGTNPPNAKYCTKTTSTGKPELIVYYDILDREVCRLDDGSYYDTRYNNKGAVTQTSYPYTQLTDPDNSKDWSKFEYDSFGRIKKEIAPYCSLSYSYNKRKITVTDHLRSNITTWKDYDALGRITQAEDQGGTISYIYSIITSTNKPRHQAQIASNGTTTTIQTDLWGNRLKLIEPNAGTISFTYTKFNELKSQTDARNITTSYEYDKLGRVTQKKISDNAVIINDPAHREIDTTRAGSQVITTNYTYDIFSGYNRGIGKIHKVFVNNTLEEIYEYDNLSRLGAYTKIIDNTPYLFYYDYTPAGQLQTLYYPDDFAVTYSYTPTGKLKEIRNWDNDELIYKVNSRNKFNAPTNCEFGNGVITEYKYNVYGLVTQIKSGSILNYNYTYDNKGLMVSRLENVKNRSEQFYYDNLDRLTLTQATQSGQAEVPQQNFYSNNGNITKISTVGDYYYSGTAKPHAVSTINNLISGSISNVQCDVTYNLFNQPTIIKDITLPYKNGIELFYGSNQQRNKMIEYEYNYETNTRYYINKYFEQDSFYFHYKGSKTARNHHYIYGDNGVVALHISGDFGYRDDMFYVHTDHLGSYCAITDENKQVVQSNRFDPWGNNVGTVDYSLTNRGFTGHEHYPDLKIINMNARLYDPVIGRFFSPDNYVGDFAYTQSYNRYSYALNNPLKYIDPTGEYEWEVNIATAGIKQTGDKGGEYLHYINIVNGAGRVIEKIMMLGNNINITCKINEYEEAEVSANSWFSGADMNSKDGYNRTFSKNERFGLSEKFSEVQAKDANKKEEQERIFNNYRPEPMGGRVEMLPSVLVDFAVWGGVGKLASWGAKMIGKSAAESMVAAARREQTIYRVFGGEAKALGKSWTPINPKTIPNYRNAAGLPNINSGKFIIEGTVKESNILLKRSALSLDGNTGGIMEYIVKDPNKIKIKSVLELYPPY